MSLELNLRICSDLDSGGISAEFTERYLRPDGVSYFLRPDGVSFYWRPGI